MREPKDLVDYFGLWRKQWLEEYALTVLKMANELLKDAPQRPNVKPIKFVRYTPLTEQ